MSDNHRICETCVYCSFAGNCDRYNNPLTSIEQPACGAYEIHPLLAENAKLRELVQKMMRFMEDGDWCTTCEVAKECDAQEEYDDDCLMRGVFHARMRELGVEVDDGGDLV